MKKCTSVIILFCLLVIPSLFGQVGIGTNAPDSSAILELQSSNRGFLMPRLTTVQLLQIDDPATGLLIFNIDSLDFWYFTGGLWLCMQNQIDTIFLSDWFCEMNILYEGQYYHTVQIGSQCWMKENLNVGTRINGSQEQMDNGIIEKYCYGDLESNCDVYGGLYQWDEMMQYITSEGAQGICPDGWHIPTDAEWTMLTDYLGGESVAGGKMKEAGLTHWASPNTGATNESGFTALPGGFRFLNGYFYYLPTNAYFWSSSQSDATDVWYRRLSYDLQDVYRYSATKAYGFSARCVQD